jgi:phosphoribosylanthranilate isomerase
MAATPLTPPRIKFCGIASIDDARHAVELGAWAVGLIFYPRSPRRCDPAVAAAIATELRRRTEIVGVFVDATLEHVAALADTAGLTAVQLHGDEGPVYCAEIARRTGCKVIKAAPVQSHAEIQALHAYAATDFHLLDGYHPGLRGGTGTTFAWELAAEHARTHPLILSGGLTPANVGEAMSRAASRPPRESRTRR